jgi:putative flippase GtrA
MSCRQFFRILLTYPRSRPWLRFGLVGLLNAAFGYTVFAVLVLAGIWPGAALAGTMVAAIAFNFQTSRRLVFRSHGHVLRFIAVYTVVLLVNLATLRALRWCGLPDLGSQALLTLPIAAMSFIGQRRFVFGPAANPA